MLLPVTNLPLCSVISVTLTSLSLNDLLSLHEGSGGSAHAVFTQLASISKAKAQPYTEVSGFRRQAPLQMLPGACSWYLEAGA